MEYLDLSRSCSWTLLLRPPVSATSSEITSCVLILPFKVCMLKTERIRLILSRRILSFPTSCLESPPISPLSWMIVETSGNLMGSFSLWCSPWITTKAKQTWPRLVIIWQDSWAINKYHMVLGVFDACFLAGQNRDTLVIRSKQASTGVRQSSRRSSNSTNQKCQNNSIQKCRNNSIQKMPKQ